MPDFGSVPLKVVLNVFAVFASGLLSVAVMFCGTFLFAPNMGIDRAWMYLDLSFLFGVIVAATYLIVRRKRHPLSENPRAENHFK